MFSLSTALQFACPLPPTPITAIFNLLFAEQLNRLGKINVPAVAAEADFRNDLRDKFFISINNYSISMIWIIIVFRFFQITGN